MSVETISSEVKKEYVKKQACFAKLSDEETTTLATLLHEVYPKKGEVIVTEGDPVDSVYLIVKGTADVQHATIENDQLIVTSVAKLKEGNAIGLNDTGFYSLAGIRTATVVADTDMVLLRLSMAAFHGFSLAYPHVNQVMRQNANEALKS